MTTTTAPAVAFWRRTFNGATGYIYVFSGVRAGPGARDLTSVSRKMYPYPHSIGNAEAWMQGEAGRGRETYAGAALFIDPDRGGKNDNVGKVTAAWVDGDGVTVPADRPQPTITVETSPGRWNYYWLLTRAITAKEAEDLNRRLAYAIGADLSGWDANQLLRVPGLPNRKYDGAPIVTVTDDSGRVHDPDELLAALPPAPAEAAQKRAATGGGGTGEDDEPPIRGMNPDLWQGKWLTGRDGAVDRSGTVWHILCDAEEQGATEGLLAWIAEDRDRALGFNKFTGRPEMYRKQARKVLDREQKPQATATFGKKSQAEAAPGGHGCCTCCGEVAQLRTLNEHMRETLQGHRAIISNPVMSAGEKLTMLAVAPILASARGPHEPQDARVISLQAIREKTGGTKTEEGKWKGGTSEAAAARQIKTVAALAGWKQETRPRQRDGFLEFRLTPTCPPDLPTILKTIASVDLPDGAPERARPGGNRPRCTECGGDRLRRRMTLTCVDCGSIVADEITIVAAGEEQEAPDPNRHNGGRPKPLEEDAPDETPHVPHEGDQMGLPLDANPETNRHNGASNATATSAAKMDDAPPVEKAAEPAPPLRRATDDLDQCSCGHYIPPWRNGVCWACAATGVSA